MATIVLLFLVSGCRGDAIKMDNETVNHNDEKQEILVWSYYETGAQREALEALLNGFNDSQDRYTASWQYVPMAEFAKKISIGYTQESLPDIVIIDHPNMKPFVDLGIFEDITNEVYSWKNRDDYYENALSTNEFYDRYFGIPFCSNNLALFCNTSLMEEQGIVLPTDWKSFIEACDTYSPFNHEEGYAFGMSGTKGEQSAYQFLPWILGITSWEDQFEGDKSMLAFERIHQLIEEGYMSRNIINWSQVDVARKFNSQEIMMMENGPWVLPQLIEEGTAFSIEPLPFGKEQTTILGGENMAIIRGKNVEGAIELFRYYNRDDVMEFVNTLSFSVPPRRSIASKIKEDTPYMALFIDQMEEAYSRNDVGYWPQASTQLSESMFQIVREEVSLEEVYDRYKKYIKDIEEH